MQALVRAFPAEVYTTPTSMEIIANMQLDHL